MPQLDRLIGALVKYDAEALLLRDGDRPALLIGGTTRPIVNTALTDAQLLALLQEIAPDEHREALGSGRDFAFVYAGDGATVDVRSAASGGAVIRRSAAPAATPPAVASAAPPTAVAPGPGKMDALFRMMVERGDSRVTQTQAPDGDIQITCLKFVQHQLGQGDLRDIDHAGHQEGPVELDLKHFGVIH